MVDQDIENYAAQIAAQKEIAKAQGEENIKPHLPTLQQQMQETQAVILEQINPKKIVAEIILELSGKEIDSNGEVVKIGEALMNKEGLRNIKIKLRSYINQGNVMSFLENEDIKNIMLKLSDDLSMDVALNWREYGIQSRTVCDMIINLILVNSYTTLKRAQEQNEKRFLGKISYETVGGASGQNKKSGSDGGWEKIKRSIRL